MPKILRRCFVYPALLLTSLAIIAIGVCYLLLRSSLPDMSGEVTLNQLSAPVTVRFDEHGIPVINANTRIDAVRALGYLTARDRLFQMDLMRRKNAGKMPDDWRRLSARSQ